ncbi:MAG: hypothetical protein RRA94_09230 [Bacteroidota bacterium]|nr:hypothetical protein [Bacteroidota bacterium]
MTEVLITMLFGAVLLVFGVAILAIVVYRDSCRRWGQFIGSQDNDEDHFNKEKRPPHAYP